MKMLTILLTIKVRVTPVVPHFKCQYGSQADGIIVRVNLTTTQYITNTICFMSNIVMFAIGMPDKWSLRMAIPRTCLRQRGRFDIVELFSKT